MGTKLPKPLTAAAIPTYVWPPVAIVGAVLIFAILARVAAPPAAASASGKLATQMLEGAKQKLATATQGTAPYQNAIEGLAQLSAATHLVPLAALEAASRVNIAELQAKLEAARDAAAPVLS